MGRCTKRYCADSDSDSDFEHTMVIHDIEAAVAAGGEGSKVNGNDDENSVKSGMECDIKNLYQGPEDNHGRFTWTDKYPENLEKAAEDEVTARFAILIRHKKCFTDSRKALEIDSIVVQSPLLKTVLGTVLADYPGVTTTLERLTFASPFKPFVHRWEEFTSALTETEDETTKTHLLLLHEVLKKELKDVIAAKNDFIANRVITYEHLWTIFQPGCIVHNTEYGRDCGVKFSQGAYIEHNRYGPCFQLTCKQIDWDGEAFGWKSTNPLVPGWLGTKPITELEAFPLNFHPDSEAITEKLLARGMVFEQLHGYHYKNYKGTAIGQSPCGPVKVNVDSRIIVDRYAHGRFNPNQHSYLTPLKTGIAMPGKRPVDSDDEDGEYDFDNYAEDYDDDDDNDNIGPEKKALRHIPLTKSQLILTTPLVRGYALKTKIWLQFFVDTVSEITWNNDAFASLVLPEDQKELILAFAESQILYKQKFDDFVSGKGKGIIMLLSGSPGVGKTLTAESVAEHMKVPLYMMGAADLGTNSHDVETSLTTILEMVAKWNAVLLLDECDVFLEARTADDLERNKLVSIFLRTLEYYEGILFLTTNRVDNMDAAFQSRIHISMEYPPLDRESRLHVWKNFLARGIEHALSEEELGRLAGLGLNGRQIKNVLKTSQLLACRKKTKLEYAHLKTVLSIELKGKAGAESL